MGFKESVEQTPGLSGAFHVGLQALGSDSHYVDVNDAPKGTLKGSVNLDEALASVFPHAARWDYAIFQGTAAKPALEHIHFVEVHPAGGGGSVGEMIKKAIWLRHWLQTDGQRLAPWKRSLIWVGTGKVSPYVTQQTRLLAQHGIKPPTGRYKIGDVPV